MERLTEKHYLSPGYYMACSAACISDDGTCEGCRELHKIVDRLAAYEDTGLTPEQIVALKAELEDERYRHDRLQDFCVAQSDQLDEAKANSLPVRVGQDVWYYHKNRWGGNILPGKIIEIFIPDDTGRIGIRAKRLNMNHRFTGQLGVDVFTEKPQTEEGVVKDG